MYRARLGKDGASKTVQTVQVKDIEMITSVDEFLYDLGGWVIHNRWMVGGAMNYTQEYVVLKFKNVIQRYHSRKRHA